MKRTRKPVHRCVGCGLNFRENCGVFDSPRDMWAKGKCPGYMNEKLLRQYEASRAEPHPKTPKEIRQEGFKQRRTQPHWNGHIASQIRKKV